MNDEKLCKFLLDNIGSGLPAAVINEFTTVIVGSLVGAASGKAMVKMNSQKMGNYGAIIEKNGSAIMRAKAIQRGGVFGALAGFSVGSYFDEDIREIIDSICGT